MIELLIFIVIALVVIWALRSILAATATPEPFATIVLVVVVLMLLVYLLKRLDFAL